MAARTGTGATLTLGTSTYTVEILSISQGDESMAVINTSHMGTTGSHTKIVGDLIDHGSVDFEAHLDPNLLDAMKTAMGVSQTCTITFNTEGAETVGAKAVGSGALTSHNYTIPLEDKMTVGYTLTWLGAVTYTDAS